MNIGPLVNRLVGRIKNLLDNPENVVLRERFDSFYTELRSSINAAITRSDAINMMAQHILIRPIFRVISTNDSFVSSNPIAIVFSNLQHDFAELGLEDEMQDLESFYENVPRRAFDTNNTEGRQHLLLELANQIGIIHTPVEIVDFVLQSSDEILRDEFGHSISDEGVHVLDPFTRTGTFLARLIQSELIHSDDLERKYREEFHANEISLPAYYLAALNIEETFHGQRGGHGGYEPFNGIVLTDTFKLNIGEDPTLFPRRWLSDNNERAENQQTLPIQVMVGSPPWSARQYRVVNNTVNVEYPELEQRIRETYAASSRAMLMRALYDPYKMVIRWATDRIQKQGIIAFVTPASWIDSNVDSGVRACLSEEFSSIYVLNLRGNARIFGEQGRSEGENVFGSNLRAPVAITILVKNPNAAHNGCKIRYDDIGNYLTREQKLAILREAKSIKGFSDWRIITPDRHYDWIRQRSEVFAEFYPLGSREARMGRSDDTIFTLYSLGQATGRDAYVYNFSHNVCAENARRMIGDYLAAQSEMEANPEFTEEVEERRHTPNLRWDRALENNLRRRRTTEFDVRYIRKVAYRPFVKTNCYTDPIFIRRNFQMDRIFPNSTSENRVICVPGIGNRKPFSALMTDTIPDIHFNDNCQCFPRYQYPAHTDASDAMNMLQSFDETPDPIDNISDTALHAFRQHYSDDVITKDAIFDYIYGILHVSNYREQFAYDLSRELPRIPFASDFHIFAEAGQSLADLHLNYETCEQYQDLNVEFVSPSLLWEPEPRQFLLGTRAMRFADREARTTLIINEHVRLSGIPEQAHQYVVNGRTPLEWFINCYRIKQDRNSGIVNDPNGWFSDPRDLVTAIERIVYVSVESARIIEGLSFEVFGN